MQLFAKLDSSLQNFLKYVYVVELVSLHNQSSKTFCELASMSRQSFKRRVFFEIFTLMPCVVSHLKCVFFSCIVTSGRHQ